MVAEFINIVESTLALSYEYLLLETFSCTTLWLYIQSLGERPPWETNKICQLLFGKFLRYNELSWKMYKRASPISSCGLSEENAYHCMTTADPLGCKL